MQNFLNSHIIQFAGMSLSTNAEPRVQQSAMIRIAGTAKSKTLQEHFDMLEYPFLTMSKYPPGFIIHLGT